MNKIYDWDALALELDGWLPTSRVDAIDREMTLEEIAYHLEVDLAVAKGALAHHRRHLGTDTWVLLTVPVTKGYWIYWISSDIDEINAYTRRRTDGDATTRLHTLRKMNARTVANTKGNTLAGRKARMIERHLGRLEEDLADLSETTSV